MWLSGRLRFTVPSPGRARASRPGKALQSLIGVEGVGITLVEEAVDAVRCVVEEAIGEEHAQRAKAHQPEHPEDMQAGEEKHRRPHRRDEDGLPEIRLADQRHGDEAQQHEGDQQGQKGEILPLHRLRERPGAHHHESRLHDFRGLQVESADEDPALGTLDLGADEERGDHQSQADQEHHQSQPAHEARRQEGCSHHQDAGNDEKEHLPVDEMEGGKAELVRHRRIGRKPEQDARDHQRREGEQQPPVNGPPPFAKGRALCAADHPDLHLSRWPRRRQRERGCRSQGPETRQRRNEVAEDPSPNLEIRKLVK